MNNVALIFPGQGSQYIGMTQDLPYKSTYLPNYFDKASDIFGIDLLSYCHNGPTSIIVFILFFFHIFNYIIP